MPEMTIASCCIFDIVTAVDDGQVERVGRWTAKIVLIRIGVGARKGINRTVPLEAVGGCDVECLVATVMNDKVQVDNTVAPHRVDQSVGGRIGTLSIIITMP